MTAMISSVMVEAPARLHFGMLDLGGSFGRRFGGVGAAVHSPSVLLEAWPSDELRAEGPDSDRALDFARRFVASTGITGGAHLRLHRALPSHSGLGSGTQLALTVARALAELHGLPNEVLALARGAGRSTRSGVGTWLFAHGGLVVEGGRREGADDPAPLLARHLMPTSWRCVIAIPKGGQSMTGQAEVEAFRTLATPPTRDAERVAHLVLMALLPAVAEGDVQAFGRALTEIQRINGEWFASAQGGPFSPASEAIVRRMQELGAKGVGQSSWGPAVYGIVDSEEQSAKIAQQLRAELGTDAIHESPFSNVGAKVRSAEPSGV